MPTSGPTALVTTKLSPPTLPGQLVTRSRLDEVLDAAVTDPVVRVVLVSAPAGSGKSTLVAAWQQDRQNGAWLQVDPADRDAARFWAHVVAALGRVVQIGDDVNGHIALAADDPGPLIDGLVNALADSDGITLVIDDYHLVSGPTIDDAIGRLIELAPESLTLALLTRWDPAIRLPRLRVTGRVVEVRAADLRFLEAEAGRLLGYRSMESPEAVEQIRVLCDRTEGWAAGLVLARLSLSSVADEGAFVKAFRGDDRLVVDYLSDELFARTAPDELQRLIATSILDEMSGPLVDAVCGTEDGAAWLADLAARNQLVIGLGRSSEWYRYHHLLRDVLQLKAEATEAVDEFHRRAGAWHRHHGDLDRAAEHLLAAGDLNDAADVIADHSLDLLNLGQVETVSGYLARLGQTADSHLRCACIAAWIHAVLGRIDDAANSVERLRALEATAPADPFATGLIAALDVMVRLGVGDVSGAINAASGVPAIPDATQIMTLGQAFVWGGRFDDAEPLFARATASAEEQGDRFALSGTPALRAVIALEQNDRDRARHLATETITVIEERGAPSPGHKALAKAVLARTTDDPAAAVQAARQSRELASVAALPLVRAYVLASAGDVLCASDETGGPELVQEARSVVARLADPGIVGRYVGRVEARHQLNDAPSPPSGLIDDLTERELAVLRYLPSPMSQRDIASELFVSLNTVKTHCKAIYRKLAVGDRKAAVQAARDAGLLS